MPNPEEIDLGGAGEGGGVGANPEEITLDQANSEEIDIDEVPSNAEAMDTGGEPLAADEVRPRHR